MDYEKLHKDTITKLQQMVNSGKITVEAARDICADFVLESEDERIRKALINGFKDYKGWDEEWFDGITVREAIAWLEKQDDKESITCPICGWEIEKQGEQKSAWSEEDEKYSSYICAALQCYYRLREDRNNTNGQEDLDKARNWLYNKLKSLRPQNNATDEELSQAKKDAYNDALDKIEYHSGEPTFDDGWSAAIWYLKKKNAQPQNTWKPSKGQLECLGYAIEKAEKDWSPLINNRIYLSLKALKEQLEKL